MNKELKSGTKVVVMKTEIDTVVQEMFFTEEMALNIGVVVTISKPVEYLDDFYTIEGDDNYNAYHISWLHTQQAITPISNDEVKEDIEWLKKCFGMPFPTTITLESEKEEAIEKRFDTITQYISQLESKPTADDIVKELNQYYNVDSFKFNNSPMYTDGSYGIRFCGNVQGALNIPIEVNSITKLIKVSGNYDIDFLNGVTAFYKDFMKEVK